MSTTDTDRKRELWRTLQAYCRSDAREPLVIESDISSCLCEVIPLGDRIRRFGKYLCGTLALHVPGSTLKVWLLRLGGAKIGREVYISPGVIVDPLYPELVTIEDDALLGLGCRLLTHEYSATRFRLGRIRIGRGAVIGAWATLRSAVTIGAGATVGACSFVNKDVSPGATVAGVPARPIKTKDGQPS